MRGLRITAAVVAFLSLVAFAGTARADTAADARAVADRFMGALLTGDGATLCGLLSPRALAALGGVDCATRLSVGDASSDDDYEAVETLTKAFAAARKSSARRRGDFVRKGFSVKQLARDVERIDTDLTVKVGKGPRAASGQLVTTVVLDTRTSARRVVIYAEADGGTIFRATGTAFSDPTIRRAAQGVAEAPKPNPPPVTYTIDAVTVGAGGRAYTDVTVTDPSSKPATTPFVILLVPSDRGYLVDDILIPIFATLEAVVEGG